MKSKNAFTTLQKLFSLVLIASAMTSCHTSDTQTSVDREETFPVLDLETYIGRTVPDTFRWNSLVDSIRFIPLSTSDSTLLGGTLRIEYIDDSTFVLGDYQTQTAYRCDAKGQIIRKIEKVGNGPGEYTHASAIFANAEQRFIDIYDEQGGAGGKRVRYDWDGHFVEEKKLAETAVPCYVSSQYIVAQGDPSNEWQFYVTDSELNVLASYIRMGEGYNPIKRSAVQLLTSKTQNKDRFLFCPAMCDTIFTLSDAGMKPVGILKKGKYDIRYEQLGDFMTKAVNSMDCLFWMQLSSFSGHYLIRYKLKDEWRLELWNTKQQIPVARTKGEQFFSYLLPSGKKIELPTNRFYVTEKQIVTWVPAEELTDEINGIIADDNPIIMILYLK